MRINYFPHKALTLNIYLWAKLFYFHHSRKKNDKNYLFLQPLIILYDNMSAKQMSASKRLIMFNQEHCFCKNRFTYKSITETKKRRFQMNSVIQNRRNTIINRHIGHAFPL